MKIASWKPAVRSHDDEDYYGLRLPSIFDAINELRIAIGEKFTSSDLDIIAFECDRIFDPAIMDDAYSDGRRSTSGNKRTTEDIVGTTGIGLGKVIEERSGKDILQTIIPAKIVLRSTLNETLDPPPYTAY